MIIWFLIISQLWLYLPYKTPAKQELNRSKTFSYQVVVYRSVALICEIISLKKTHYPLCYNSRLDPFFLCLLRYLLFCLLFLFVYLLFPTLVLILLAFISHCAPPCFYLALCISLSLSDIVYPLFRLSLIFSARGCRCIVNSVFAFSHYVEIQDLAPYVAPSIYSKPSKIITRIIKKM